MQTWIGDQLNPVERSPHNMGLHIVPQDNRITCELFNEQLTVGLHRSVQSAAESHATHETSRGRERKSGRWIQNYYSRNATNKTKAGPMGRVCAKAASATNLLHDTGAAWRTQQLKTDAQRWSTVRSPVTNSAQRHLQRTVGSSTDKLRVTA
jgi:hypothetical protein